LDDFVFSTGEGLRFPIQQFPLRFYLAKRFSFDDGKIQWEQDEIFPESLGLKFVFALGIQLW
jgi:outer membrane protein insertion porin family